MKKILLVLTVMLTAFQINAQQKKAPIVATHQSFEAGLIHTPESEIRTFRNSSKKTRGGTQYYNWRSLLATSEGLTAANLADRTFVYSMFPDSNVRFNPPNNAFGVNYQSIGQVMHPQSSVVNTAIAIGGGGDFIIGANQPYTVDSVYVRGSYNKVSNSVDTLIFSVLHSGGANLSTGFFFSGAATQSNFGVDTARFAAMNYNMADNPGGAYQVNQPGAPAPVVYKYVLTNNDSSSYTPGASTFGIKTIGAPINLAVPAGEIVAASVTFKPGYTYSPGDTIGANNFYMFRSTQPNGTGSTADPGTYMPFTKGNYCMSNVLSKDTTNYGGMYVPSIAFTKPFAPEVHDMIFQITCVNCAPNSVNDIPSEFTALDIYPNPANDNLNIELTEVKTNDVNISLYTLTGKKLISSTLEKGSSKVSMDVSSLPAGIYLCEFNSNGQTFTRKVTKN